MDSVLNSTNSELAELVHRVGRRLRRGYGAGLEPFALSPGQARALRVIAETDPPLKMVQLADHLRIAPRSVTPVIDALEEAGLVRREVDPANRRSTLLLLTPTGERTYAKVREARRAVADTVFAVLGDDQRDRLRDLLAAVDTGC